ncbi:DNA-binding SARP family transcriptional activator [Stackebrandtia endophytica]|uniref:DNA-binding SARP family transcriptional activator n=1 Tax=Stackebrandtia endophytica TaxID=1496996 RepID=A0A543B052_9ACTN|nr:BTAD domain-containing putative transcriptional regulator [Stackebrandtia endophytica]TQL78199.1 DNA-binding SARP family transcriptional activator [Stackebrandtia endophytica]
MIIRLLGTISIADGDDWRRAGPAKQSAILATLAMDPREPVDQETLIERVWGSSPPQAARSALYAYIARLRKMFEAEPEVTITRGADDGYRLKIVLERIDLFALRDLVSRAKVLGAAGRHDQAVPLWREAAGIPRSTPLANIVGDWADEARRHIEAELLNLAEERFNAELAVGRHREILTDLAAAVADHPRSQRLVETLMLGLYRDGRADEALQRFDQYLARVNRDESDEPGADLLRLRHRIQAADASLNPVSAKTVHIGRVVPQQLPAVASGFVGRAAELSAVTRAVTERSTTSALIVGMAGVGKTAMAVRWAHREAERFPDGQLFTDLRGFTPETPVQTDEVLGSFLRSLGVNPAQIPDDLDERIALYRSMTGEKQLLVVLDNAADPDQVRDLLPGGDRCFAVVTSRDAMSGLVASEGAHRTRLGVLDLADARELVAQLVPDIDTASIGLDDEALGELVTLCGGLPLALRIAFAELIDQAGRSVSDYLAELRDTGLRNLSIMGDPNAAVEPAFELSYQRMPETGRRLFRTLGLIPSQTFGVAATAAMLTWSVARTAANLRAMVAANLLEPIGTGRYRLHDLVREYANRRALAEDGQAACRRSRERWGDWYVHTAHAAARVLQADQLLLPHHRRPAAPSPEFTDTDQAIQWLETEHSAALATMREFGRDGSAETVWLLADAWRGFYSTRTDFGSWRETAQLGLDLALAHRHHHAAAAMGRGLGWWATEKGDSQTALAHYRDALTAAEAAETIPWQIAVWAGIAAASYRAGELTEADSAAQQAVGIARRSGVESPRSVLNILGITARELGRLRESATTFEQAVELNRRLGSANLRVVLGNVAEPYRDLGRLAEAQACVTEAMELDRRLGSLRGELSHRDELARILIELGRWEAAENEVAQAMELVDRLQLDPMRPHVLLTSAMAAADDPAEALRRIGEIEPSATGTIAIEMHLIRSRAHRQLGRPDPTDALAARRLAAQAHLRVLEGKALTESARTHHALGETRQAIEVASQALECHRETGHRPGEARTLRLLADLTGDGDAMALADRILAETRAVDHP